MDDSDKQDIRMLLRHYSLLKKNKRTFFTEISCDESQLLLVKTTPEGNANVKDLCSRALNVKEEEKEKLAASPSTLSNIEETSEDGCRSRSASPLRIGFSGTIEKYVGLFNHWHFHFGQHWYYTIWHQKHEHFCQV